jgi:hypothetical protein
LDIQQTDGCWAGGNIADNGFLLYSIWPEIGPGEGGGIIDDDNDTNYDNDCEGSGYFCMSSRKCTGNILEGYDTCGFPLVCCSEEYIEPTCEGGLEGTICSSGEYCTGREEYVAGLNIGESCCVGGNCEEQQIPDDGENTCIDNGGVCETYSCSEGYLKSDIYSCTGNDTCCMKEEGGMSYWWIWVLFVLIILVVIAIIYREKLKDLYYEWKAKHGKNSQKGGQQPKKPGYPPSPGYNRMPTRPPMQRKMIPPQQRRPIRRPQKNPRELDDVLKKLKDMGK